MDVNLYDYIRCYTLSEKLIRININKLIFFLSGVDVTANQEEITDHEIFQLEFDMSSKRWYIRTMQDKYWSLQSSSGIQANADKGYEYNVFKHALWQGRSLGQQRAVVLPWNFKFIKLKFKFIKLKILFIFDF